MRASDPPVQYLVGTPKGRLTRLEKHLLDKPWQDARLGVRVKLLAEDDELYVFAQSVDRVAKERAMRRRQLKWLWKRLAQLTGMTISREELLMKLGAARTKAPTAWRLIDIDVLPDCAKFTYSLNRRKLRTVRRREGRYLLRTNITEKDPATLWNYYIQLVAVEEAFKNLKDDLAIRPIFHKEEHRIEAHIFISFLAYCLYITLQRRLHPLAPGLTARSAIEKFAAVQMIDVLLPIVVPVLMTSCQVSDQPKTGAETAHSTTTAMASTRRSTTSRPAVRPTGQIAQKAVSPETFHRRPWSVGAAYINHRVVCASCNTDR